MKQVYSVKPGGAVLGCLDERDPEYERRLERSGIDFEVTPMKDNEAPSADVLQRATVREVERGGKKVKEVQIDREGFTH